MIHIHQTSKYMHTYFNYFTAEVCVHPPAEQLAGVERANAVRESDVEGVHHDGSMEVLL